MRVALAAGVFVSFALLPRLLRTSLLGRGSPVVLAWFGVTSLLGIAAGLFALLAATVSPGPLPLVDLPRAVEICIGAAGRLLSHPLKHWPSILAAVLFLATAVRVIVVAVLVTRDAKRARPPRSLFPGEERALRDHLGIVPSSVRLLPFEGSVAFTTGLVRPVTVVSDGLMRALAPKERSAVVAHERAHASRRHTAALLAARIIARAFGFVPGVRVSVELLVTALEAWADEQATMSVGTHWSSHGRWPRRRASRSSNLRPSPASPTVRSATGFDSSRLGGSRGCGEAWWACSSWRRSRWCSRRELPGRRASGH